jgi:hypothetical protein
MEVLDTVEVIFQFTELLAVHHHLVVQTLPLFVDLVDNEQPIPENSKLVDTECSSDP